MAGIEGLLASAKTGRGQVNILVILLAFVLSTMIVDTRDKCSNKDDKFKAGTQFSYGIAVVVIVLSVVLFGYDLALMAGLIK
jgi:hypothetical protein